eukprot:TRINITY_DN34356_c0_g1_i1.p1 TRINITY_DN34356_c0_g1~~TRINITY_DN34356_c0_g1_i1.p1  ORF type:complete len:104 (-),score=8.78 TRINITY_DN34356_c0_g1_i1:228-539(-)
MGKRKDVRKKICREEKMGNGETVEKSKRGRKKKRQTDKDKQYELSAEGKEIFKKTLFLASFFPLTSYELNEKVHFSKTQEQEANGQKRSPQPRLQRQPKREKR